MTHGKALQKELSMSTKLPDTYRSLLINFMFDQRVPSEVTIKMMRELRRLDNERKEDEQEQDG